jgi:hypothetical protein
VPQGAVISVTFFLIAINDIVKNKGPEVDMVGYADDWVIYSTDKIYREACNRVQECANRVERWTMPNGCQTLGCQQIETVTHRRILGLIYSMND